MSATMPPLSLGLAAARAMRKQFRSELFVRLPRFLEGRALQRVREEAFASLTLGQRRDLRMPTSQQSPRHMRTVSGRGLKAKSQVIPRLYRDPYVLRFLSNLVGTRVLHLNDDLENYVVNLLEAKGDEHGAHLDEFPFAFNILLVAPPAGAGGQLEFVRSARMIDRHRLETVRPQLAAGDAYIMRADRAVHWVTPLEAPTQRMILSMAYADLRTAARPQCSRELLYG